MSTFLYIVLGLVVLVIFLGILAPKTYNVNRSIVIQKSAAEVFDVVRSLKKMDLWSPWAKKDPNMEQDFTGTDGEVGSVSSWSGNKDVGSGEHEITQLIDNELVASELRFLKPFKSTSDAYIKLEPADQGTRVTWGFSGKNKFPFSIMMLFMNMDKQVGKDFEEGLENLKNLLESNT
jgi:hypothetical protein